MKTRWRNLGAPFITTAGIRVGRGREFVAPEDSEDVVRRRGKLQRVGFEPSSGTDWRAGYPGIDFGSDRAYEVARDAKPPLVPSDFYGRTGSGRDGAFLTGDVRIILAEREHG